MSTSPAGPRTCAREGCGSVFTAKRADARYCSDSCRNAANRARSRSDPIRSDNRPDRITAVSVIELSAPLAWEPTAEPRDPRQVNEACLECGERLFAAGRATRRACLRTCQRSVIPPGVAAPYRRDGQAVRQVKSQRERDLEAIALAQRKGIMLGELAELAADKRLNPDSAAVVEWFAEEVRAARSDERLTELAERFRDAGIRSRRWWQSTPAAIETADHGDETEDDESGYGYNHTDYDEDEGPSRGRLPKFGYQIGQAAAMAELSACQLAPATVSEKDSLPDYSAELAARNWIIRPHGAGLCNLVQMRPHGWDYLPPEECIRRAEYLIAGAAICDSCFNALNQPMRGRT